MAISNSTTLSHRPRACVHGEPGIIQMQLRRGKRCSSQLPGCHMRLVRCRYPLERQLLPVFEFCAAITELFIRSADERTGRSVVFLDNGICSVFVPEDGASGCPAYFKFGARSGDSSDFRHIPSTISTCASLDGFDVVFSQAGSALLHCLPLGDYDGTQEFVPALSFTRMPGTCFLIHANIVRCVVIDSLKFVATSTLPTAGDIAQLACVPESELLAAADTQGALALFSTSDATRLDYKPECCRRLVTALHAQQGLVCSHQSRFVFTVQYWQQFMTYLPCCSL